MPNNIPKPKSKSNKLSLATTPYKLKGINTIDDTLPIEDIIAFYHLIRKYPLSDIARELGVSQPTISYHYSKWKNKAGNHNILYGEFEKEFSTELMSKALGCVEAVDPGEIHPNQRMTSAAIAFDKLRLIHGQSTQNINQINLQARLDTTRGKIEELAKEEGCSVDEFKRRVLVHMGDKHSPSETPTEFTIVEHAEDVPDSII